MVSFISDYWFFNHFQVDWWRRGSELWDPACLCPGEILSWRLWHLWRVRPSYWVSKSIAVASYWSIMIASDWSFLFLSRPGDYQGLVVLKKPLNFEDKSSYNLVSKKPEYWHLIGWYLSPNMNTGLWLVNTYHMTRILASNWFISGSGGQGWRCGRVSSQRLRGCHHPDWGCSGPRPCIPQWPLLCYSPRGGGPGY